MTYVITVIDVTIQHDTKETKFVLENTVLKFLGDFLVQALG